MTGLVVQRMALDDWTSEVNRVKSVVAITPVSADGYPADDGARQFLWNLIGQRDLSEKGFSMITGQRFSPAWERSKTNRHLETSTAEALKGYYRMWLDTDFSAEVRKAKVGTPFLVIGGRQDLPGFQEEHLRKILVMNSTSPEPSRRNTLMPLNPAIAWKFVRTETTRMRPPWPRWSNHARLA